MASHSELAAYIVLLANCLAMLKVGFTINDLQSFPVNTIKPVNSLEIKTHLPVSFDRPIASTLFVG
jgi:hypothetical protein